MDASSNPQQRRGSSRGELPAWAASAALHVLLLLALAATTWHSPEPVEREITINLREAVIAADAGDLDGDRDQADGAFGDSPDAEDPQQGDAPAPEAPSATAADSAAVLSQPSIESSQQNGSQSADPVLAMLDAGAATDEPAGGEAATGAGMLDGSSDAFQRMIGRMQRRGLDVVFVLDATGNMGPFIQQAQERLEQIVGVLTGMIPPPEDQRGRRQVGVRFGIVAFKDYGDEYGINATIHQPLTSDHDRLREFLDQIVVGGGGDQTEPLHEALAVATDVNAMGWRRGSESVVVLVTEANVHLTGREAAMATARSFSRGSRSGHIHVIDVGASGENGRRRENVLDDLQNIADFGGGSAFLLQDEHAFWQQLIVSIFGPRYTQDVEAILRHYGRQQP